MMKLDNNAADILSLDAGEVFVGGRYNSLIPLMQQLFEGIKYIDLNVVQCLDI
jgi:melanoma-associated antigen p97